MWFVAALLAFSLAYAMLRRVHAPAVARRLSGAQVMVAAALLIAVTAFVTWRWWPPDDASTFWHLQWESWPQGAGLFALGVWAGEARSLEDLAGRARRLGWTALAAVVLLVALAGYEQARGQDESTLHGAGWAAILGTVLYGIISVAFTLWFTVLIRARWSGGGPVRARAGRASYATYVLHPLVLTAIMVLFASLALAPELKFLVVAVVAVPVCFLAGYAATRVPGIPRYCYSPSRAPSMTILVSSPGSPPSPVRARPCFGSEHLGASNSDSAASTTRSMRSAGQPRGPLDDRCRPSAACPGSGGSRSAGRGRPSVSPAPPAGGATQTNRR